MNAPTYKTMYTQRKTNNLLNAPTPSACDRCLRMLHSVALMLALAMLLPSCAKDIVDTTGNINGTVRDARTNEVLSGAAVTVAETGASMTTGSDGTFAFRDLLAQSYTVKVSKSGYKPDSKTVHVTAGKDSRADFSISPSVAELSLSNKSLDFGAETTSLTFDIHNTGTAPLTWSVSEDIPWLSCAPTSGTTGAGEKSAVVVNVKRDGLERGNYSQSIAISSNGGSEVVRVDMQVPGMNVTINPTELDFGTAITSLQLTLTNEGTNNVTYTVKTSNDWIRTSKTTGTFTTRENINVSVDRTDFSAGEYNGSVTINIGSDATVVPVHMAIPVKELPTVTLISVDDITYKSAIMHGGVVAVGSAKITRHGFCWSTSSEPTLENSAVSNLGDCSEARDFSYTATSLEANTTYYARAYAENAEGVSYSNIIKFKTPGTPEKPSVESGHITDITDVSAVASGNIISLGNIETIIQYGHVWGTKSAPTIANYRTELGATTRTGAYISTLTSLAPNTKYYVRAYATNSMGTTYGEEMTFTTNYGAVVLETGYAKDITYRSALVACKITSRGGNDIIECGVCYSTAQLPTTADHTTQAARVADNFDITLTGLDENVKYCARAYARTAQGQTYYGNEITFTTFPKDIYLDRDPYPGDSDWE